MEEPEKLLFVKVHGEVRQQKETTMETSLFFVTQLLSSNPLDWNLLVLDFSVETLLANLTKAGVAGSILSGLGAILRKCG
jgi:hypothetical protein